MSSVHGSDSGPCSFPPPGRSLEVEIELPSGSDVAAGTVYGGVETSGRLDTCRVACRYGDLRVEETGSLALSATYGSARRSMESGSPGTTRLSAS